MAGALTRLKLEGIDWVAQRHGGAWESVVVAGMDDPDAPAVISSLLVDGARLR